MSHEQQKDFLSVYGPLEPSQVAELTPQQRQDALLRLAVLPDARRLAGELGRDAVTAALRQQDGKTVSGLPLKNLRAFLAALRLLKPAATRATAAEPARN